MFYNWKGLYEFDFKFFDTSWVNSMFKMFYLCSGLTTFIGLRTGLLQLTLGYVLKIK